MTRKLIEIYTDGACSGNPGPGGWGAVLKYKSTEKQISGGEKQTTNNRMEMTACIMSLSALKEPCDVRLTTDSKYIVDAVEKGWAVSWQKNGWRKSDKRPALNCDLWEKLLELIKYHNVEFCWIKGHNGHRENEICDDLAVRETKKFV
ncbi:MAG: ribonuclease HI [Oscillospiraceae bacterium]